MAGLRVFVSSTCVDLEAYRFQIRGLLARLGYEPLMSDHSEILYDPGLHTHASCLRDVQGADLVILLIGSRLGGTTATQAMPLIDFDQATRSSGSTTLLNEKNKISITQAEAIQASNNDIPIFTFVDSKVYADHHIYQANKDNPSLSQIKFPSIQKQDSAKNIFEFINYLSHRSFNNSIITFQSFAEIEDHLLKQWSLLFQRILQERKERAGDNKKSIDIVGRIEELKSAVLQALPKGRERDVARAVVRYRRLADFITRLASAIGYKGIAQFSGSYRELLNEMGVVDLVWDDEANSPYYMIAILTDGGFVGCHEYLYPEVDDFAQVWKSFVSLEDSIREAVIDAAGEMANDESEFEKRTESLADYHNTIREADAAESVVRRRVRRLE